jgi:hypothetical protein
VLLITSTEPLAECRAQLLQAVEEFLALFPCACQLSARPPANIFSQRIFAAHQLATYSFNHVVAHVRSLCSTSTSSTPSLPWATPNLTGRFLKSVFRREPGHTSGSQVSNGNPLGIYRLGHCSLQRPLSLKPARLRSPRPTPDAQGDEDQQDHNDSTQAEPKKHGATTILPPHAVNHPL